MDKIQYLRLSKLWNPTLFEFSGGISSRLDFGFQITKNRLLSKSRQSSLRLQINNSDSYPFSRPAPHGFEPSMILNCVFFMSARVRPLRIFRSQTVESLVFHNLRLVLKRHVIYFFTNYPSPFWMVPVEFFSALTEKTSSVFHAFQARYSQHAAVLCVQWLWRESGIVSWSLSLALCSGLSITKCVFLTCSRCASIGYALVRCANVAYTSSMWVLRTSIRLALVWAAGAWGP